MDYLSRGAKKQLKKYLKKVGRAMRKKGTGREEIESVIESLREQVYEIVGEPEQKLSKIDMSEILGNFDAPAAFGSQVDEIGLSPQNQNTWVARLSIIAAIGGVFMLIFVNIIAKASGGDGEEIGGSIFVIIELLALLTGLVTFRQKYGKMGAILSASILLILFLVLTATDSNGT